MGGGSQGGTGRTGRLVLQRLCFVVQFPCRVQQRTHVLDCARANGFLPVFIPPANMHYADIKQKNAEVDVEERADILERHTPLLANTHKKSALASDATRRSATGR